MIAALAVIAAADAASFLIAVRAQDLKSVEQMLAKDPELASAKDEKGSAVSAALGARRGKEGFVPRRENALLAAIVQRHPQLSPFEVFALGTVEQVRAQLAADKETVRQRSSSGWTPLHYAAFADNAAAAAVLIAAGAEVDARAKNKFDNTPLQVAMLTLSVETARVLLAHGADVNARQSEGVTALHEAAFAGDVGAIQVLLAAGADPGIAMPDGKKAIDFAREHKHLEAARALEGAR
ncbi:MAG TPA: ankyrin repeat domain-containing protein [Myxococcales bacterium]|jgi:ankyrin repeat protein|nr:ankyrin repeat domain-containing protein [Myxococcales bacterium]